jgi:orotate phosphoribosyltransferase
VSDPLAARIHARAHLTGSFRLRSGGQIIDSCRRLRELGAIVDTAMCVIDREAGGADNLARESVVLHARLTGSDRQAAAASRG